MKKKNTVTARVTDETLKQMGWLARKFKCSLSEAISLSVAEHYRKTKGAA